MAANAYLQFLDEHAPLLLRATPQARQAIAWPVIYSHWDAQNEWVHAEYANFMLMGAYLYTEPDSAWHQSPQMLDFCLGHLEASLTAAVDHRWFHGDSRKGDKNIDRFTGIAFMEAQELLSPFLTSSQQQRIGELVTNLLENQYNEFGSGKDAAAEAAGKVVERRLYANMDAYYALMMAHGYRITGNEKYLRESQRFVGQLGKAQYEDGAWSYIDECNECFIYHGLNLIALSRVAALTKDQSAWEQLRRSVPYYPMTLTPDAVAENHTDVWWKHQWQPALGYGPDVIGSLFEDGPNRHIGNQLREASLKLLLTQIQGTAAHPLHAPGFFVVAAARTWKDVAPTPSTWRGVFIDRNIRGPRAHLEHWSWAATAGFACDTLVGAVVRGQGQEPVCALLAISPEITHQHHDQALVGNHRHALATTPRGVKGRTTLDKANQSATFEATYPLTALRTFWNADPHPVAWQCSQRWTLGPQAMVGQIELTSLKDQSSAPPAVRIRLGMWRELVETRPGCFDYGSLRLRVVSDDFIQHTTRPCSPMPSMTETDSVEIMLLTCEGVTPTTYAKGQIVRLQVEVTVDPGVPAGEACEASTQLKNE